MLTLVIWGVLLWILLCIPCTFIMVRLFREESAVSARRTNVALATDLHPTEAVLSLARRRDRDAAGGTPPLAPTPALRAGLSLAS